VSEIMDETQIKDFENGLT